MLDLKTGARILDIPSGYGRHSIELAARGFDVVGSELNSVHLEKAKQDAQAKNVTVNFVQENMIDISYKNEFDTVINMFYSFGFFETDEENEKVLQHFYEALKPGGKFLMHTDVNIPRIVAGLYKEHEVRKLKSGAELEIIDSYNTDTKRIEGSWIIKDAEGNTERKDYSVRVYTKGEFIDLCKKAGFTEFAIYGDWQGSSYSDMSEDMIIVATK